MFDGNRFLPVTGMPMRKMACMSRPLALADPVPFTFASLMAKSFTATRLGTVMRVSLCVCQSGCARFYSGVGDEEFKFLHVPSGGRATLRTKAAMDAKI